MKIAFVCESLSFGGIERVVSILSDSFLKDGSDVSIITTVDSKSSFAIDPKIHVFQLPYNVQANAALKVKQKISALRKTIKNHAYDVCIAFGYKASVYTIQAAKKLPTKVVISERTDPDSYGNKYIRKIRDMAYRKADLLVCQTDYVKAYYAKRKVLRSVVIPNPVRSGLPERYEGERDKVIVNFCRLNRQKNIPMMVDAFSIFSQKHGDYTIHIYGEGALKEELVQYIAAKGLSDKIQIFDFAADVHQRILQSAMFVSSSDYEGISNSMLEALAIGLPSICTDCPVGGARLVIESGVNGILVPLRDAEALAEAMTAVADDRELSERLSKAAVGVKTRFSVDNIIAQWKEKVRGLFD